MRCCTPAACVQQLHAAVPVVGDVCRGDLPWMYAVCLPAWPPYGAFVTTCLPRTATHADARISALTTTNGWLSVQQQRQDTFDHGS